MKKYKLLSWVLSLVMALTVFSIPVSGYATGGDENSPNYCLGNGFVDEEDGTESFFGISEGDSVAYSDIDRLENPCYLYSVDEYGDWSPIEEVEKIVLNIDNPKALGVIDYYDEDKEKDHVSTSAETTINGDGIDFVPLKAAENIGVSAAFYDSAEATEPITTINFTVSVAESDLTHYCLGYSIWNEETDDSTEYFITNGDTVAFSAIGRDTTISAQSDEYGDWSGYDAEKVVWTNENPAVVGLESYDYESEEYKISTAKETVLLDGEDVSLVPRKAGQADISVAIYSDASDEEPLATISFKLVVGDDDVVHYRLGWWDQDTDDLVLVTEEPFDSAAMGDVSVRVFSDGGGEWEDPWFPKQVWHVSTPELAKLLYEDEKGKYQTAAADFELNEDTSHGVHIVPQSAGIAEFSVDVYDDADATEPIATIPLRINITQEGIDRSKYEPYLYSVYTIEADFDTQKVYGEFDSVTEYNKEYAGQYPEITEEDLDKLQIKATVGGQDYNATLNRGKNTFTIKLSNAKLGDKVKMTYTMGSYTTTENLIVTQWIKPKYTVKTYTYNGKKRTASVTVTYKGKTLKKGVDYSFDSGSLKNVGRSWYSVWSAEDSKYRFSSKEGYFKINPKGTSIKTLKKAKKAFTVTWGKQATKMAKARITGYQIQLATNNKFTKNKKTVTVKGYKNTTKKIKNLKKKKKYFVRVRTYMKVGKITYYSGWSKVKSVKTK